MKSIIPFLLTLMISLAAFGQSGSTDLEAFVKKANEEILNKQNYAYIDQIFAEDYTIAGGDGRGPQLIHGFAHQLLTAFPDLHVSIDHVIQEGEWVAWRRTHTGTHQGEFMGIPPTGKKIQWESLVMSRIVDGKILYEVGQENLSDQLRAAAGH